MFSLSLSHFFLFHCFDFLACIGLDGMLTPGENSIYFIVMYFMLILVVHLDIHLSSEGNLIKFNLIKLVSHSSKQQKYAMLDIVFSPKQSITVSVALLAPTAHAHTAQMKSVY